MPAKLTHTQEASFLLDIIKHSDLKSINWQAIAEKKQIKKGAAQMRYQRLKQAIEKAEAADAGITLPPSPGGQSDGLPTPQAAVAPTTPKKPRANKVEKTKTPSSGRKKKINVDVSMISPVVTPNASMISSMSTSMHSPMRSMHSPMNQSMHIHSPTPAPMIKMEAADEYRQIQMMSIPVQQQPAIHAPVSHMPGMPY